MPHLARRLLLGSLTALVVSAPALVLPAPASASPSTSPPATATSGSGQDDPRPSGTTKNFRGVNWADPRDNYASDEVVPSGLDVDDSYRTVYRKAFTLTREFRRTVKANTIRLPVNPASVGTDWWKSYRGAVDAATDAGDKVILGYWESDSAKDGRIDDVDAYNAMWDTLVRTYRSNPRVYFEPMNEPFGYTLDEWVSTTSRWLARHYDVPRKRVVISGTGYNDDVTGVGAAPELRGTLLSLHFYGYWASDTTEAAWKANLEPRIGSYGWRTVVDEAGSPMTTGLNYGNHEGDVSTAYLGALTETARARQMGIVYWPGLRTGDSYTLTTQQASGRLQVTNASGLAQLQWGWGLRKSEPLNDLPPAPPGSPLRNVAGDRCLDVPGGSTSSGTALDLWDCNGGGNQSWNSEEDGRLSVYASSCLTVGGDGRSAGSPVLITSCTGGDAQTWSLEADGSLGSAAGEGLCLAADGSTNGSAVSVATCDGSPGQRWTRS